MARGQCERRSGQLAEQSLTRSGQTCIVTKACHLLVFLSPAKLNIQSQEDAKELCT